MQPADLARLVMLGAVAALILRWNLWRALLCVRPELMRLEVDAPPDQAAPPDPLARAEAELLALGFTRLGSHTEQAPLSRAHANYDYAHGQERAFATLFESPRGEPRLYFLTPTGNGGLVITADHRRPARAEPGRYLSGGLAESSPERLFKAHQRRVASIGAPNLIPTLEARLDAGRAWYAGVGRREVRQQNALGLLWTVGTLGMVLTLLLTVWR